MIIKKKKVCEGVDMKFYTKVVRIYFDYMKYIDIELECKDVSELLRHSLCKILCLDSECALTEYTEVVKGIINVLKPLFPAEVLSKSKDYKMGILEACVHCVEFAREKVESDNGL